MFEKSKLLKFDIRMPNFKPDSSTEKRIRSGIVAFLMENIDADISHLLPLGNTLRQYLIPCSLVALFIDWFQVNSTNNFSNFDTKRKIGGYEEEHSKRFKSGGAFKVLDLQLAPIPKLELIPVKE